MIGSSPGRRSLVAYRAQVARALVVATLMATPMTAFAQPGSQAVAQKLFDEGLALMEEARFSEACPKLAESQRLDPAGGTLLNLGSCLERVGQLASAYATYNEALSQAIHDGRSEREAAARERLTAIQPRISHLLIDVRASVPGLEISLDGTALRAGAWGALLPINPGPHTVTASAPGRVPWEHTTTISAEGTQSSIEIPLLEIAPAQVAQPRSTGVLPAPSSPATVDRGAPGAQERKLGWILGASGVALLAAGAVTGGLAFASKADSDAECPTSATCSREGVTSMKSAEALAWTSTTTLALGLAAAVVGVVLVWTAPRGTRVEATAGGVSGTF